MFYINAVTSSISPQIDAIIAGLTIRYACSSLAWGCHSYFPKEILTKFWPHLRNACFCVFSVKFSPQMTDFEVHFDWVPQSAAVWNFARRKARCTRRKSGMADFEGTVGKKCRHDSWASTHSVYYFCDSNPLILVATVLDKGPCMCVVLASWCLDRLNKRWKIANNSWKIKQKKKDGWKYWLLNRIMMLDFVVVN